jgi:hypothetical protein
LTEVSLRITAFAKKPGTTQRFMLLNIVPKKFERLFSADYLLKIEVNGAVVTKQFVKE